MARLDLNQVALDGMQLAFDQGLNFNSGPECVWALTKDAARAIESAPSPMPRGHSTKSAMPEPVRSQWEIFGVERERITDGVHVETEWRYQPDARAIDRAEVMQRLWCPQRLKGHVIDPQRTLKALWLHAGGTRPARIREIVGMPRPTLYAHKDKCCAIIAAILYPYAEQADFVDDKRSGHYRHA